MPRVNGGSPGFPKCLSEFQYAGRSAGVYKRCTGAPEVVVNRARPSFSRFIPLYLPIGFSGDFFKVGSSVVSAQSFSRAEGRLSRNTSAIGLSVTGGFDFSAIGTPRS